MRIRHLVLTDSFAGAEQHVCVLANEQARHRHQVEVWGGDPSQMRQRLGPRVTHRPCSSWWMATKLRGSEVDVVHAHMTQAEVAAALSTLRPGQHSALVTTRHFAAVRGRSLAGRVARPALSHTFRHQIAVSKFVADRIDGPSTVVHAGVANQPEQRAPRDPVLLVAQRLSPEKHTLDALYAFAGSGLAQHGWRIEFVGRGGEQEALKAASAELGLGRSASFLGFVDDLQVRLAHAAIFLATAPAEPFGLSVVEAMSWGTPVIATAAGGHLETVGRASGATLYQDVATAGSMLRELARDAKRRAEYGRQLRSVQQEFFTLDRQYAGTLDVYRTALES